MSRYFTKTLASLEPYTPGEQLKIADIVKLNAATAATKTCCWRCGPSAMKIRRWPLPM